MNRHPCRFDVATRPRARRGGNGPRDPRPLGRTTDRRSGRARALHPMTEECRQPPNRLSPLSAGSQCSPSSATP